MNTDPFPSPRSNAISPSGTRAGVVWLVGSKGVQERIKASDAPIKFLDFAQLSNKLICLGAPSDGIIALTWSLNRYFQTPQTDCMCGILHYRVSSGLRRTSFLRRLRRSSIMRSGLGNGISDLDRP